MAQDLKPVGEATAKVKVLMPIASPWIQLMYGNSPAAYAITRKLSATSVCCSAMRKTPRKTVLPRSTSTRVVWRALGFSFLERLRRYRKMLETIRCVQ